MRHRLASITGIGGGEPVMLDNNFELKKNEFWDKFLEDAQLNFKTIDEYEGFDFHLDEQAFTFGIEPSYKFDKLQIIHIDFKNKQDCYIQQGIAFGYYGSKIVCKIKRYGEYTRKTKFIRFIDKWYKQIMSQCRNVLNQSKM